MRYFWRRLAYAIPILLGVNFLTFLLFFMLNTPDDIARAHLGGKQVSPVMIERWKQQYGYDKPLFYNAEKTGAQALTQTLWVQKSLRLFLFDFGLSDRGNDISYDIQKRAGPSLALAIPALLLSLWLNITLALLLALFRFSYFDRAGTVALVLLMAISPLFYIMGGQFLFAKIFKWVPLSGYVDGFQAWRFLLLPVLLSVLSSVGGGVRWYRGLFLEILSEDYVRTARAKGLSEWQMLWRHVLPNALLPIITGIVVIIPSLFMGSLLFETFFGIPGMGSYTIEAIQAQDFAVVRVMVFLGTLLYLIGLWLTDVCYLWADPRLRLGE